MDQAVSGLTVRVCMLSGLVGVFSPCGSGYIKPCTPYRLFEKLNTEKSTSACAEKNSMSVLFIFSTYLCVLYLGQNYHILLRK